jgi:small-conductance mechanosensitive channel
MPTSEAPPINTHPPQADLNPSTDSTEAVDSLTDATGKAAEAVAKPIEEVADTVNNSIEGTYWENVNVWDNSILIWGISIGLFLATYIGLKLLIKLILTQVQRTNLTHGGLAKHATVTCLALIGWPFYLLMALSIAAIPLHLPANVSNVVQHFPFFAVLIQTGVWLKPLINLSLGHYVQTRPSSEERNAMRTLVGPLRFILITVLWSLLGLIALDNAGVNVTALVASLGIGGIAIGLALQNVLGDLFASLSIALDKPFVVDEFIITNDYMGTVKHIGLRTTRLESLGGEHIVIPNSDLTSTRIRNYTRMERRRVVIKFGVIYSTDLEHLKAIPTWVKTIMETIDGTTLDRIHFMGLGASSLDFELVYYVEDPEYNVYMDTQQAFLLALMEQCRAEGVTFAYPTQTVYVETLPLPVEEVKSL